MKETKVKVKEFEAVMGGLKRAIMQARERSIAGSVFSRTQLEILTLLQDQSDQTTSQLAHVLALTPGAVTQTVETLVQRDLVERQADAIDRRVIRLQLSPAGRQAAADITKLRHQRLQALLSQLSPEELESLINSTKRLTQLIENERTA